MVYRKFNIYDFAIARDLITIHLRMASSEQFNYTPLQGIVRWGRNSMSILIARRINLAQKSEVWSAKQFYFVLDARFVLIKTYWFRRVSKMNIT